MSVTDLEAILRRHGEVQEIINWWNTSDNGGGSSLRPEFTNLRTDFENRLLERGLSSSAVSELVKELEKVEEERQAETVDKMHKSFFFKLCNILSRDRTKQWFHEWQVNNELPEDNTLSNNDTPLSSEHNANDLHFHGESTASKPWVSTGGKGATKFSGPALICMVQITGPKHSQEAQLVRTIPIEAHDNFQLTFSFTPPSRIRLRTKGDGDEAGRPNKRRCVVNPQETQVELDDPYSSDHSSDTVPCTNEHSDIENDFCEVSQDEGHQSA